MKHFVVESTYRVSFEALQSTMPAHRAYMQTGIDQGLVLCSGPKASRAGGIIILRADSLATVEGFFASDPYVREGLADYRFVEFEPLRFVPALADWVGAA